LYFYLSKILAPFINLTNFIIFLSLFLFFINIKIKKRIINILIKISICLFLIISFFPIGNIGIKYLEKDFYNQKTLQNFNNIIVLAGAENINATKVTNKLNLNGGSERLISSVKLALSDKNIKIYFLGGDGHLIKSKIDEVYVSKLFFTDIGFDLNRVKFINNTRNTIENLKEFKKLELKNDSNVLITSAFHMKRAMMISNKLNIDFIPYAVDFKSTENYSIINYYQTFSVSNNLRSFDIFFREMIGILAFNLFY